MRNNNNQSTKTIFAIVAVVLATSLIASVVLDQAYAKYYRYNHQVIKQNNNQEQSSSISTSGTGSTVTGSGGNTATATNTNNGGNA